MISKGQSLNQYNKEARNQALLVDKSSPKFAPEQQSMQQRSQVNRQQKNGVKFQDKRNDYYRFNVMYNRLAGHAKKHSYSINYADYDQNKTEVYESTQDII